MDKMDNAELSDEQLERIYETAKREGALKMVTFDVDDVTLDSFTDFARHPEASFYAVHSASDGRPFGFFYLTNFEAQTARLHFCLLKAGRDDRHELGRAALSQCFERFEHLQCLIGVVPVINQGACQYAREMGGREMGIIPGMCWIDRLKRSVGGVQFLFEKETNMGGMLSKPKTPKVDDSALRAAEKQRQAAQEEAAAANAKQLATEEANTKRKKNVTSSGRAATVLAGENSSDLLGG